MLYQAITTKFLGLTNTRPSRIKATASAGSIVVLWNHALRTDANHTAAAEALARKLGWTGTYQGGGLPDGKGTVYVRRPTTFKPTSDRLGEYDFTIAEGRP